MKLLKTNERGRSMIEMLGVLAIVGILSVGGIAGFSKAMNKYKTIKAIEQYNMVFDLIVTDMDKWRRISYSGGYYKLSELWKKIGVLPESVIKSPTGNYLYDIFGNMFEVRKQERNIQWLMSMNSENDNVFTTKTSAKELCLAIFTDAILPRQSESIRSNLYLGGGDDGKYTYSFYGDAACSGSSKCLRDMTMTDIIKVCEDCEDDKLCRIGVVFFF